MRGRLLFLLTLFLLTAAALFFFWRRDTTVAFGPAVALCPGPDLYGYTCQSGEGYAYIDATRDTRLYEDDGVIALLLPFPFIFYGTTYTEIHASSNGVLQFGAGNPAFFNQCLTDGPVPGMGDMIAPFWDDLDLRLYGYLETEVVGVAPDRIFVIEWDDVPIYGDSEDRVTFAVQLFEGSNDIVFLYTDVTLRNGNQGSSATIGLQSEMQGIALQYSCNQPAVANASRIRFAHPQAPNQEVGLDTLVAYQPAPLAPVAKGEVAVLVNSLNQRGPGALSRLRGHWLSQSPPRHSEWEWTDLTGNGRFDLVLLWRGSARYPELTRLLVLAADDRGQMQLALDHTFSTRRQPVSRIDLVEIADVTHDGVEDVLLLWPDNGQLWVVTAARGVVELLPVPAVCHGNLIMSDTNRNGRLEIVRDGCFEAGRFVVGWNGHEFAPVD